MKKKNKLKENNGTVLTIALFLIFSISVFAMAASAVTSSDIFANKKYKQGIQASFLSRAGIEIAIQTLKHDDPNICTLNDAWYNNPSSFKEVPLDDGFFSVISEKGIFGFTDEESKININTAPVKVLAKLGNLNVNKAKMISDSRNIELFNNTSELVSRGIVSSDKFEGENGLKNLVTIWGDGKININTASREVLSALPGLNENSISTILSFRNGADGISGTSDDGVFNSARELGNLNGVNFKSPQKTFTVKSDFFYVVSKGFIHLNKPSVKKTIEAIVKRDRGKILIQHWNMF